MTYDRRVSFGASIRVSKVFAKWYLFKLLSILVPGVTQSLFYFSRGSGLHTLFLKVEGVFRCLGEIEGLSSVYAVPTVRHRMCRL